MGMFDFLPKQDRCCFCTRNMKVACVLIAIWSMFATCQEIRLTLWPTCESQFEPSYGGVHGPLTVIKWMFFAVNLFLLSSSFAYLLGIFMSFPITADVFICFGILSSIISLVFCVMIVVQMVYIKCTNPSDVISLMLFISLRWGSILFSGFYFITLLIEAVTIRDSPIFQRCKDRQVYIKKGILYYVGYINLGIIIVMSFTAMAIFIGVILKNRKVFSACLVIIICLILLDVACYSLLQIKAPKKCKLTAIEISVEVIFFIFSLYLLWVLKSYLSQLTPRSPLTNPQDEISKTSQEESLSELNTRSV